jgi:hypothetical protein
MSSVARKAELEQSFLGLAGHVERLVGTDPNRSQYNTGELKRWQELYTEESAQVLANRTSYLANTTATTGDQLQAWCEYARATLKHAPTPRLATE